MLICSKCERLYPMGSSERCPYDQSLLYVLGNEGPTRKAWGPGDIIANKYEILEQLPKRSGAGLSFKCHQIKLQRVVEAVDTNNAAKLQMVVNHYQSIIKEQASQFKADLVDKISDYIDIFIESKIPQKSINEAVKNQKARIILNNLRESLAINSALMSESLKDALIDGKTQIDKSKTALKAAQDEAKTLRESFEKTKAALVLEQKTAHLNPKKKQYALRVFEGKSPKFIVENIDYTLSLFDKKEEERLVTLKEEAFESRKVKSDRIVIEEDTQEEISSSENNFAHVHNYLNEMSKY